MEKIKVRKLFDMTDRYSLAQLQWTTAIHGSMGCAVNESAIPNFSMCEFYVIYGWFRKLGSL